MAPSLFFCFVKSISKFGGTYYYLFKPSSGSLLQDGGNKKIKFPEAYYYIYPGWMWFSEYLIFIKWMIFTEYGSVYDWMSFRLSGSSKIKILFYTLKLIHFLNYPYSVNFQQSLDYHFLSNMTIFVNFPFSFIIISIFQDIFKKHDNFCHSLHEYHSFWLPVIEKIICLCI